MKNYVFYLLIIGQAFVFYSCSNEILSDGTFELEDTKSLELKSDLIEFAENYNDAYAEVLITRNNSTSNNITKEHITALQGLDKCVKTFTKNHDIYADLSEAQKAKLVVSEDSAKLMALDTNVLLSFMKKNKSEEFYEIARQFLEEDCLNYTADEIVNNDELYLNEKFALLTILPFAQSRVVTRRSFTTNPFGSYSPESPSGKEESNKKNEKACKNTYDTAVSDCNSIYNAQKIIDAGLVVGAVGVTITAVAAVEAASAGTGTAVAVGILGAASDALVALGTNAKTEAEHTQCLNNAKKEYKECLEK